MPCRSDGWETRPNYELERANERIEFLEDTIAEDGSEYVKFKTGNSIYEWKKF